MAEIRRIIGGIGLTRTLPLDKREGDPVGAAVKSAVNRVLAESYRESESKVKQAAERTVTVEEMGYKDCSIQLGPSGIFFSVEWPLARDLARVRERVPRIYVNLCEALDRRDDVEFEGCELEFVVPFDSETAAEHYLVSRFLRDDAFPDLGYGPPRTLAFEMTMGNPDEFIACNTQVIEGRTISASEKRYFVDYRLDLRKTSGIPFDKIGNWTQHAIDFLTSKTQVLVDEGSTK